MNNKNIVWVIALVVVAGVAFYGGMAYGKSQATAGRGTQAFGAGNFGGNFAGGANARGGRGGNFGGVATGEVLSKDAQSITLKLRDGGSKIIFYSDKTTVGKMIDGKISDFGVGNNVSIMGTANTDGSINAQTIQIRPNMPAPTPTNTTPRTSVVQ